MEKVERIFIGVIGSKTTGGKRKNFVSVTSQLKGSNSEDDQKSYDRFISRELFREHRARIGVGGVSVGTLSRKKIVEILEENFPNITIIDL